MSAPKTPRFTHRDYSIRPTSWSTSERRSWHVYDLGVRSRTSTPWATITQASAGHDIFIISQMNRLIDARGNFWAALDLAISLINIDRSPT